MATDAKKKNTKKKPVAAEDKKAKKAPEKADKPVKSKKQTEEKAQETPRSAKLIHQFIPFIFFAIAVLVATCLIAVKAFSADMGVAGNLIATVLCGLFGWGAFFLPVILVFIGSLWHRIIDDNKVGIKTILSTLAVLMFSILIHVFFIKGSAEANFNVVDLWNKGAALFGGGVLGGLLSEFICLLFKHLGTIIITIACLAIVLMSLFELTPKNIITFIKYKRKLAREKKEERLALAREEEERLAAEREKEEKERRAEEIRRKVREEQKGAAVAVSNEMLDGSAASVVGEDADKPEEKKLPEVIILEPNKPEKEETHDDDDCQPMSKIFSDGFESKKNADGIVAIDLPAGKDKAKKIAPKAEIIEKPKEKEKKISLSMKVDAEEMSELEGLRGGDGEAEAFIKPSYVYPPVSLLKEDNNPKGADVSNEMNENAAILRETLASFNIGIKDQILCSRGPTITRYELRPEVGVRVRSIANLIDDISLSLATSGVRIEAPIPNKPYVGIEVPNRDRLTVFLRSLIENEKFSNDSSKLTACLGSDVGGHPVFFDISKMPHLLIAGATGMGKSVCINSIIISLLYKANPDEVKLILIDPKKVEFNVYKDIPHLYAPIVSDPKKAAGALASAVAEMERRFELIEEVGVRDINNYNAITADDPEREYLPKMVIIIDELADLMMTAPGEVESSICRLAQKARAAGIHIIIGTQRPSVDVITGLIKANVPSRIACTVASQVDSRTIIDIAGAEKLIGKGDMLFAPVGLSKPMRVQGCFVSDAEVEAVVEFIKENNVKVEYNEKFISCMNSEAEKCGQSKKGGSSDGGDEGGDSDPKFREAVKLAIDAGKISTSLLQRMIGVGYGRAAKLIDKMEAMGYVSAPDGNKPRRVLITMQEYMEKVINDDIDSGDAPEDDEE